MKVQKFCIYILHLLHITNNFSKKESVAFQPFYIVWIALSGLMAFPISHCYTLTAISTTCLIIDTCPDKHLT